MRVGRAARGEGRGARKEAEQQQHQQVLITQLHDLEDSDYDTDLESEGMFYERDITGSMAVK